MLYLNEKKIIKAYTSATRCMSVRAENEDIGGYWITDGFTAVKCYTPEDWRTIGGAIFGEAAGAWTHDNGGTHANDKPTLAKTLCDMVANPGALADVAPMVFDFEKRDGKIKARVLYDAKNDIAVMVNAAYLEYFGAGCVFRVTGDINPVVVLWNNTTVGIVLPIKPKPEIIAAARAYFGKADTAGAGKKAERKSDIGVANAEALEAANKHIAKQNAKIAELKKQLAAASDDGGKTLLALEHECDALRANLAAAENRIAELEKLAETPAPVDMPAPVVRDIAAEAEAAAVKFRNINGKILATVKGANTSAPVVWIGGDVAKHEAELEAAGAVYSKKRGAWYYRVIA